MSLAREEVLDGTDNPLSIYSMRSKNSMKQISLNKDDKDAISNLPDDILIKILSVLDTKSAISTDILSKRWKHLFRFLTHFNLTLENRNSHHDEKMTHFTTTIQNLLGPNITPNIRSLFIDLKYYHSNHNPLLDACVLNAFSGKLEHFELFVNNSGIYKFPLDSLDGLRDSIQILHIYGCALIPQPGKLTLTDVVFYEIGEGAKNVEDFLKSAQEKFHILINGCLNLEILFLMECEFDGVMRIDTPSLHFKEINCVDNFTGEIEIVSAPKLESLEISNSYFVVGVESNPSVKCLRLGFGDVDAKYALDQISSIFPCLHTLVLCFEGEEVWLESVRCSTSFMKLKHLVIEARIAEICHPFWISLILEAAPFLEIFEINIETDEFSGPFEVGEQLEPFNFQDKNLEEFKVTGFDEGPMVKNLVRFIMESATALGKMVLCNDEGYYEEFDATGFSSIFE
ncbi:hypothetical protein LUZ60_004669 [Juncus effusus]|nr:hypothetical protein LUZ60_004669 [Juncus effusus]